MTRRHLYILFLIAGIGVTKSQTSDTINKIDGNKHKQGQWSVTGKDRPGSCYEKDQVIETGRYKDNKKTGLWTEYYCNNNIKNKITFKDGRPDGQYELFYENGKLQEQGIWHSGRPTSAKYYTEDGKESDKPARQLYYEKPDSLKINKKKDTIKIYDYPDKKIIEKRSADTLYRRK